MNTLLRPLPNVWNPRALALVVLALHGAVAFTQYNERGWQLGLIGIMLLLGINHVFKKPYLRLPIEVEFALAVIITFILLLSTGGTSSYFFAWLLILALYYPLQLQQPLARLAPFMLAFAYLILIPASPPTVPAALAMTRSLLVATIGWSVYDLGKKLKQANQQQEKLLGELRSSEKYIRQLVETIPGITYVGAREHTLFMSPQVETLLGYPPQEFIEDKTFWHKCLHPDDFEAIMVEMHRKYAPGEMFACEYRMIAKDGRNVWFRDEARVERDSEGYIHEMQGLMLDITQRKEDEFRLSYQASLLDHLFDSVISTDKNFNIVSMNKTAELLYGYTEVEVKGKSVGVIMQNEYAMTTREAVIDEFIEKGFWVGEVTQVNKSGQRFPVLGAVSKVLDKAGNYIGAVAINKDMREMKKAQLALQESETRYRQLLEQAAEGIFVSDQNLQLVLVNQAMCELLGYPQEELLAMKVPDLIDRENLEQLPLQVKAVQSGNVLKTERLLRRKDGSSVLVEGSAKTLPDGTIQTILRDIGERKRAEETLKKTEAFYRVITEQSNEGIYVFDKDKIIRYRSASNKLLTGFADEEIIGRARPDLIHTEDLEKVRQAYNQLLPGESVTLEYRLKRQGDEWFWNESRITNLLDNPAVNGYLVNYHEITQRKQAEEKLQQTEAFYRAITEKSLEGVVVFGDDKKIRYQSLSGINMSGYSDHEMIGHDSSDIFYFEDGKKFDQAAKSLAPGESTVIEYRIVTHEGHVRWLEGRITNLLDYPEIRGYVVNYHDISNRKQAEDTLKRTEAFYRAVTEKSYEGIAVADKTGKILYRSTSNVMMSGYQNSQIDQESFSQIVHPEDQKGLIEVFEHLTPNKSQLVEHRYKLANGEWKWLEARITNLVDYPAVNGYVINTRDITERKKAEAMLREFSQRLLKVQEEERRSLARELHDEIGQSLTAIKVSLQTLQKSQNTEVIGQALSIADGLLAQVRELSLNLHPRILEDLGLISAVRWYCTEQAKRGRLDIELNLAVSEEKVPEKLKISIYRIIQEGLTNIIRHSKAHHAYISLAVQGNEIVLKIKDDGSGFDLNRQTKSSLGLASMQERAGLHGGNFELFSSPGQGTDLSVMFPVGK